MNLNEFLSKSDQDLENLLKDLKDKKGRVLLKPEEVEKIIALRKEFLTACQRIEGCSLSLEDLFSLKLIARGFVRKQLERIKNLKLEEIIPNPFLIKALGLRTPREVVELHVYMLVTRSMVTSMGFLIEKLLLNASKDVEKGSGGWDIVVTRNGERHWIQVKSGPNDMDKDQILRWKEKIEEKEKRGEKAYIGIAYGNKKSKTVTLDLIKGYLKEKEEEWKGRTLIGRELWKFVSGNENYVDCVLEVLYSAAKEVLGDHSIVEEIKNRTNEIEKQFIEQFIKDSGSNEEGIEKYVRSALCPSSTISPKESRDSSRV